MLRVTQLCGFGIGGVTPSSANKILAAGVGAYSLTGTAAGVRSSAPLKLVASAGAYGLTGTAAGLTVGDANFSSVALLVPFDGVDGATTATDIKGHALTFVGNAQIDTAIVKMGSGALLLDGTGDYVSSPTTTDTDWDFGSLKFTVEGWFRFTVKNNTQGMVGKWSSVANISSWFFYITGGQLTFTIMVGTTQTSIGTAWAPTLGQWYHLAIDRSASNDLRIYVDGAMVKKQAAALTMNTGTVPLTIGAIGNGNAFPTYDYSGSIDDLRISRGLARYASDAGFAVPTAPYRTS